MNRPSDVSLYSFEWPTWILATCIYMGWGLVVSYWSVLGSGWGSAALLLLTCWYMSLQHELVHGHPTRLRGAIATEAIHTFVWELP